ncbi:hypothetical protein [Tenacibaculum caenipelagi]|uniref:3-hydroxymyristoyl/3-hydroxydecanoyl-(Acyl carrier protein) dehydratase n=1 Tax=Tenacibaculum caenipelagi TaxID=1325435 RepID=A0A4V3D3A5_9FLAO|nr:hypothetical protein [Tenacibaculum caenipelagi]TDQ28854.1 hypothetical protein DFQ07_1235 [Tenacibaculum caenipelagi]
MNLLKSKIADKETLLKLIPQRDPIVMISALTSYTENAVVSELEISNETLFVKEEELKEPGLIEHMAQTVALYTGYHFYINNMQAPEGYIGAIKGVEINKLPKVGDTLVTEVNILQEIMGVTLVKGVTRLNDEVIMTAQMKTVLKK